MSAPSGELGCIPRGSWSSSHGTPVITVGGDRELPAFPHNGHGNSHLMLAGTWGGTKWCLPPPGATVGLLELRQLFEDTLVAMVDTLPLLNRVKAEVEVAALFVVDRQLSEAMELALDANCLPLRVLVGDTLRLSTLLAHRSM